MEKDPMEERRSSRRAPTILEGRIWVEGRSSYVECTVRNLSETGAQIHTLDTMDLPDAFRLEIPRRSISARVRLMWSRGRQHGVHYLPAEESSEAAAEPATNPRVQEILASTREQLAQVLGLDPQLIRLTLDINC